MNANADRELINLSKKLLCCFLVAVCAVTSPHLSSSDYRVSALSAAAGVGRRKLGVEPCELTRGPMRAKRR